MNIEDKNIKPQIEEIIEYVDNPLFDELFKILQDDYSPKVSIEYSGEKAFLGWNVKYKKSGKTLCTVYPRKNYFPLLLIVGKKEKADVEAILPSLSEEFRKIYNETREFMGQKWMMINFDEPSPVFQDILRIIKIRRTTK